MTLRYHMLPPPPPERLIRCSLALTSFSFPVTSQLLQPGGYTLPPAGVHSVVSVEGRVEMQRMYYLKLFMCHEGQTAGKVYSPTQHSSR